MSDYEEMQSKNPIPKFVLDQSEKKISSDGGHKESSSTPPQAAVESVKKWKTWLLSDSEVM